MSDKKRQKQGRLIMASNCLGIPEDIPIRSLEALKVSDLLVFEEDRPARQSLKAAGVHREYLKFTEHKESETLEEVSTALRQGKSVCYMSDQGAPTVADPGRELLQIAYRNSAKVEVIPGPSSITAALSACPFLENSFLYRGFLPREKEHRDEELHSLSDHPDPIVFLETPYRRKALLESLSQSFGHKRSALLAVDISGPNEGFYFDSLENLSQLDIEKLNFVVVTEGSSQRKVRRKPTRSPYRKGKSGSRG